MVFAFAFHFLFLSIPSTLSKRGLDYDECTDGRQVYGHSFTVECYRQYVLLFACMFLPCCTPPLWRTTTHYLSNKVHHVFPGSADNTMLPRRICNCHCEHKPRSGESVGMCVCGCVCLYLPFIKYILLLNGRRQINSRRHIKVRASLRATYHVSPASFQPALWLIEHCGASSRL